LSHDGHNEGTTYFKYVMPALSGHPAGVFRCGMAGPPLKAGVTKKWKALRLRCARRGSNTSNLRAFAFEESFPANFKSRPHCAKLNSYRAALRPVFLLSEFRRALLRLKKAGPVRPVILVRICGSAFPHRTKTQ
jgi:hypothetical protein